MKRLSAVFFVRSPQTAPALRGLGLVVLASLAILSTSSCSGTRKDTVSAPETVRDLPVVQVKQASVPDYIEAVGTVRASQSAQLSAEIVATVREVRAVEGQRVHRGDVLVALDDAQQQAALERAQAGVRASQQDVAAADADLGLAQSTQNRYQALFEKKSVSPHEFDEVQARYKAAAAHRDAARAGQAQAQAQEMQARTMLGYTRSRAPFDAVVTAKNVDPGALAAPGVPLLTVEDTRQFRLEATVDESDLPLVKLGASVPVAIDALGGELAGKVVQLVPVADPASRSFVVKIQLPNDSRLRSGIFGRAHFSRGQRQAIVVPESAIVRRGQLQGVYLVGPDGLIDLRYVTLGKRAGSQVEILSGLTGGERLVADYGERELAGKKLAN